MATAQPPAKPKLSMDELAAQYGYAAAFFNSNPELTGLINQAVGAQWTPDKFRAALMASQWYRTQTESARQWIEVNSRDPAEAQKRISDKSKAIQQMANQQGISLGADRLKKMATDSLSMGWDDLTLQQAVAAEWKYKPGGTAGGAATLEVRVKEMADEYGVSVSDAQVADFIGGSMAGRYTEDNIADFMRDSARSKYPGLQGYLDTGMTVKQVAAPYVQSYAQILEQGPETVSVNDPAIQKALQGIPAKDKQPPVMAQTLYDFERDLRKDPRWLNTKNAKDSVQNTALGVLKDFGIYG